MSDVVTTDLDGDPHDVVANEVGDRSFLDLNTEKAEVWVAQNVADPQWWCGSLVVELSSLEALIMQMSRDGLRII